MGPDNNVEPIKYLYLRFKDCESTYNKALAGFKEFETPDCESVTGAWQESGGGRLYRTTETWERRGIHYVQQRWQSKALMWEERFLLWLSILVRKNRVDVCQIVTWFGVTV